MNMPSGAPEEPPYLITGELLLDDERRAKGSRDIMALDIETIPQRRYWDDTEPYEIDHYWVERHLDPGAVFAETAARLKGEAPMQATGQIPSCHPTTAHVVSVSCGLVGEQGTVTVDTVQMDEFVAEVMEMECQQESVRPRRLEEFSDRAVYESECKVLARAWQLISWALDRQLRIVTFNGKQFDLPMLRWRSSLLEVKIPKISWYEMLYRYRHKEHVDIRLLISDGDTRAKGTLAMWCKAFGIEAEESGADVFDWAWGGQWDEIRRYGGKDINSTIELFHRVEGAL